MEQETMLKVTILDLIDIEYALSVAQSENERLAKGFPELSGRFTNINPRLRELEDKIKKIRIHLTNN